MSAPGQDRSAQSDNPERLTASVVRGSRAVKPGRILRTLSSLPYLALSRNLDIEGVKEARKRLLALWDCRLPAMPAMLRDDEAAGLLGAAVAAADGRVLSARPVQATWRPGKSLCVTYHAAVAWNGNVRTAERFVAATGERLPEGALRLARDDEEVAVWRMNDDPGLPGLAIATSPEHIRELLAGLGVLGCSLATPVRSYRPGRRAVVEVVGGGVRLFLKIVPPGQVAELQERHNLLSQHLPVPRSHGWLSEYGLVVLEGLPGETLRDSLRGRGRRLPAAAAFVDLLDRMPPLLDGRVSPSPLASVPDYALLLCSLLPELAERVQRLQEALCVAGPSFPAVSVHGDFHEAQVLIREGDVVGLLDIDSVGIGCRIDDWANMIGHLAAWRLSAVGDARLQVERFTRDVTAAAEEDSGQPAELRRRVAAVLIGLATGPFRAQTRTWPADTRARVGLAERWLGEAESAA